MTDRPAVTLTVKAFRQEGIVAEAVASALAQDYDGPLEILLSDDCSPDGTFAVMERMAADYRGPHAVRLNRNPVNLGIVGHANRIAELASGALLAECAGDDIAEPHRISRLVAARGPGVMAVHSRAVSIDAAGRVLGDHRPPAESIDRTTAREIATHGCNCIGATALWDRRLFTEFGPIPAFCPVEDAPLFFRAALLGRIAYVDEALMRYREGGLSGQGGRVSPGHDHLYGDRIRFLGWRVAKYRSFLADLDRVGHPEAAEIARLCRAVLDRHGFEVRLSQAGTARQIAMLPEALARSLRAGHAAFLREALRHILGPVWVRWSDWRRGGGDPA